jgi:hypothetical protein
MTAPERPVSNRVRYGCVGCLTFVSGGFSGAMIAVLIGKIVGSIRNCEPPADLPACDWQWYAGAGMLIGAFTLPVIVMRRLRAGERSGNSS